jgi:hypothetical protein
MANDWGRCRREFVAGVGTTIAAAVAGCSGDGGSPDGGGDTGGDSATETPTSTPEPTDNSTATDSNTTDGEANAITTLLEDDEPEIEKEYEANISNAVPASGWIEMENPAEQIPKENYDFEEYPNLQILVDEDEDINAYDPDLKAVYLFWLSYDGKIGLGGFQVMDYEPESDGAKHFLGSDKYTDESADIEGILSEVVEGVNDVPEDLDEEYVELLT